MKKIILLVTLLLLGCGENGYRTANYLLPPELKDCIIYVLTKENGLTLYVMRCPNSTTSVNTVEKYPKRTVVIDGITFEEMVRQ